MYKNDNSTNEKYFSSDNKNPLSSGISVYSDNNILLNLLKDITKIQEEANIKM